MSLIELTACEQERLSELMRGTADARVHRRALAVLQVARGQAVEQVAALLNVHRGNIYRWVQAYARQRAPQALADQPGRGRPAAWGPRQQARLRSLLASSPQDLGYPSSQWTVPLLSEHLRDRGMPACSDSSLRRQIHALNWVWKRGQHALQPDPQREKKTAHPKQAHAPAAPQRGAL